MYQKIDKCRICGNQELVEVLDLGTQALTGVFPKSREQTVAAGPLKLVKCTGRADVCGLLQLQHTYSLGDLYGSNYGYRSGLNSTMIAHLRGKVSKILDRVSISDDSLVIDIGSNDSTTLQAYPRGRLLGVDPTGAKFRRYYPPHVELIADFFSAAVVKPHVGDRKATVITSFSMFYDLEDPSAFMREVAELLDRDGIWVFEQSYMPTMLARNSYDTVCHEHLEYYALKQIKWMADRAGLKIIDVEFNEVNGGSFSIVAARQESRHVGSSHVQALLEAEIRDGLDTLQPYREFAQRVLQSRQLLRAFLEDARRCGKSVGALGASTKGNVLLQYCGITESDVAAVGEVNPDKFACYTPGSLLPIRPEAEVLRTDPDYLLVLPWHFRPFFEDSPGLAGRQLLFPLPHLEVTAGKGSRES
jgi:hypothetical protein